MKMEDNKIETPIIKNTIKIKGKKQTTKYNQYRLSIPKRLAKIIGMEENNFKKFYAIFWIKKNRKEILVKITEKKAQY